MLVQVAYQAKPRHTQQQKSQLRMDAMRQRARGEVDNDLSGEPIQ
jgi:hypothetical protein